MNVMVSEGAEGSCVVQLVRGREVGCAACRAGAVAAGTCASGVVQRVQRLLEGARDRALVK